MSMAQRLFKQQQAPRAPPGAPTPQQQQPQQQPSQPQAAPAPAAAPASMPLSQPPASQPQLGTSDPVIGKVLRLHWLAAWLTYPDATVRRHSILICL